MIILYTAWHLKTTPRGCPETPVISFSPSRRAKTSFTARRKPEIKYGWHTETREEAILSTNFEEDFGPSRIVSETDIYVKPLYCPIL